VVGEFTKARQRQPGKEPSGSATFDAAGLTHAGAGMDGGCTSISIQANPRLHDPTITKNQSSCAVV
jgi:hypothetical protein